MARKHFSLNPFVYFCYNMKKNITSSAREKNIGPLNVSTMAHNGHLSSEKFSSDRYNSKHTFKNELQFNYILTHVICFVVLAIPRQRRAENYVIIFFDNLLFLYFILFLFLFLLSLLR